MDKLINNFSSRESKGIWGAVVVTGFAAGAILFASGHGNMGRSLFTSQDKAPIARTREHRETRARESAASMAISATPLPLRVAGKANAAAGERRYLQTCSMCHGAGGLGQPHMGANLRDSRFIREQSDEALVTFVKTGRPPGDTKSVLGLSMPPMGGNPTLDEGQIRDIVAYLRNVQSQARAQGAEAELN